MMVNQILKLLQFSILAQISLLIIFTACHSQAASLKHSVSPSLSTSKSPYLTLKKQIDSLISAELLPYSVVSIKVVSLKSGSTRYEINPQLLVTPASLQKLFTSAAALSRLSPDHAIETSISVDSENNTLYLKGCGDPLLTTADLTKMVSTIAGKLSFGSQYNLVGDTGCFDDEYWGNGWMWDDEPAPEAMYLSALSVNGNTVAVTVAPGMPASSAPDVSTEPSTRYVNINNIAITVTKDGSCAVSVARTAGDRENMVRVSGSLAPECKPVSKRLTVWRPELYALTLLAEKLEQAGIKTGSLTVGNTLSGATKLASATHSVSEIITEMLKNSDNLSAENLFKYLAHTKTGQKGTAADGAEAVKEYLRLKKIPTDRLVIADGSGVSRYNLTSAASVTRLLVAAKRDQATFPFFEAALSLAGRNGTLAGRMKGTVAAGRVKAKTGSMKGVSALAGYTVTEDGEPLAFSMIMQNFTGSGQRVRDLQDQIAVLLSSFSAIPVTK
jgi:D-alanyl-D-alanine carboxypeptidase/D-alanyl-D-alanine-endopeptidase (penicillin-binding protein 4)